MRMNCWPMTSDPVWLVYRSLREQSKPLDPTDGDVIRDVRLVLAAALDS